ncbi:MAG: hypothetical protein ACR2G3_00620 [Solirubrobacterales bacterium]
MSVEKTCPDCGETKDVRAFAVDPSKASGRRSYCKPCDRARARAAYEANAGERRAKANARNAAAG